MSKALVDRYTIEELTQLVNSSSTMKELLINLGYKTTTGNNNKTVKTRLEKNNISIAHFSHQTPIERNSDNVFCLNSTASQATLRRWYLKVIPETECAICGQEAFWNKQPLVLTLDHINGQNKDNRLENLRWICPNCDRQLSTFAGKNLPKTEKVLHNNFCKNCGVPISDTSIHCIVCHGLSQRTVTRPSREELKMMIRNESFSSIGRKYGINGNAIKKWCIAEKLPYRKIDIKEYSDENWVNL